MRIKISKYMDDKCYDFALARMPGSQKVYKNRGELNENKMLHDIYIGAIAEVAVYKLFTEHGLDCTKPDFTIYEKKNKTFNADLCVNGFSVHVKSQSIKSAKRYGASWLFQKTDKLFKKESAGELMVFCLVEDDNSVTIEAIADVCTLMQYGLIDKPKLPQYAVTKHAIYLQSILDSKIGEVEEWTKRLKLK